MIGSIWLTLLISIQAIAEIKKIEIASNRCDTTYSYETKKISTDLMKGAKKLVETYEGGGPTFPACMEGFGGVNQKKCSQLDDNFKKISKDWRLIPIPKELRALKEERAKNLEVAYEISKVEFEFSNSKKSDVLKKKLMGFDPSVKCQAQIKNIENAQEQNRMRDLDLEWGNCVRDALIGSPEDLHSILSSFLKTYGIKKIKENCDSPD